MNLLKFFFLLPLFIFIAPPVKADVPHTFSSGELIKASEINDNFLSANQRISELEDLVNSNNSNSKSVEDYSYNFREVNVGRNVIDIIGLDFDLIKLNVVSFKDHSLFTIRAPVKPRYSINSEYCDSNELEDCDANMDISLREERYNDSAIFEHSISDYPAQVSVSVNSWYDFDLVNSYNPSQSQFSSQTIEKIRIGQNNDESGYIYITTDFDTFICNDIDLSEIFPTNTRFSYFHFYPETNSFSDSNVTSIEPFQEAIENCKDSIPRRRAYSLETSIYIYTIIKLDESTTLRMSFSLPSSYLNDFHGKNNNIELQDRDFSDDLSVLEIHPRKDRRENIIDQLLTLFDYIKIEKVANED